MRLLLVPLMLGAAAHSSAADTKPDTETLIGESKCRIVKVGDKRNVKATWDGPCVDGFAEGKGILVWFERGEETVRYEGELRRGKAHGDGYRTTREGEQYEGGFVDGRREGKGIFVDYDGSRFDGHWVAGLRTGAGSAAYTNGARYDGQWLNSRFHGRGRAQYAGGQVIEGDFSEGYPVGQTRGTPEDQKSTKLRATARDDRFRSESALAWGATEKDLPYGAMTKGQQQVVRSNYPMLHADDEPPFPLKGLRPLLEWMSYVQGQVQAKGTFIAHVLVDSEGNPTSFKSYSRQPAEMTRAIARAMTGEKYKPALCAGKPCAMEFRMRFHFVEEFSETDK